MSSSPPATPFAFPSSSVSSPAPTPFSSSCSPTPARMWSSSVPASTAASSPQPEGDEEMLLKSEAEEDESPFLRGPPTDGDVAHSDVDAAVAVQEDAKLDAEDVMDAEEDAVAEGELSDTQLSRLERVLERSALYSSILKQQMDDARERYAAERAAANATAKKSATKSAKMSPSKQRPTKRRRRGRAIVDEEEEEEEEEEVTNDDAQGKTGETGDTEAAFPQPALVTGARLKDYQLEGLQWMVGLNQQGISGILADEMGLGKTLQTIAFAAHLRATGTRPFLVVCPLSVLHNWMEEFKKFAPGIPVLMYHGTPAERAEMRRTVLTLPEGWPPAASKTTSASAPGPAAKGKKGKATVSKSKTTSATKGKGKAAAPAKSTNAKASGSKAPPPPSPAKTKAKPAAVPASPARRSARTAAAATAPPSSLSTASRGRGRGRGGRGGGREGRGGGAAGVRAGVKRKRVDVDESDEDAEEEEDTEDIREEDEGENDEPPTKPLTKAERAAKALEEAHDAHFGAFPVVITTYDLIIRDRPVLSGIPWGYIVVDEGHRLKNMNCALMREVKRYSSAGRMVLTGTPLHNNLAELWSLLNFILPDIFDDVDAFQEWFSLPRMSALLPSARMGTFITKLHTILKPFLLRRMKADVLGSLLPPKKSYVLYARLSARQREAYEAVLGGGIRAWVAGGAGARASVSALASNAASTSKYAADESGDGPSISKIEDDEGRTLRARRRRRKGEDVARDAEEEEEERRRAAEVFAMKGAAKHVNNMKLQNTVMQLRKVCSHPFLFARPDDDTWSLGRTPLTPELLAAREAELLGASGKMLLLDRLLGELFRRGHKVLLFSQFTTMLDIIEDWAVDMKGWAICRIDGTTPPLERRDQMNFFQNAGDAPDAPRLFLLSTRSGGLGVNLTAADTVIFYDQDWNPQMDVQAQDRAHRIGQTKPVLIFRLISAHTIEEKIMQRATEKRKLEALVIAKGKFKMPAADAGAGKRTTMAEMAADLLRLEGEQIDVLPTTTHAGDTDVLSDADMEALLDRSPEVFADRGTGWRSSAKGQAAFAVFEPPPDAGSDALAGMMGEEGVEE
ncbi:SNF2 family N-terminal domain-containing protein [Mycena capillaripes]|nr:SNF2 family N-terminal domain-containing protein [Mycena capillaripes]